MQVEMRVGVGDEEREDYVGRRMAAKFTMIWFRRVVEWCRWMQGS